MAKKSKQSSVAYNGPTPDQINAQYAQQQQLLAQQQSLFATQYQQQQAELQGAYENSLSLLQRQMSERASAQDSLLNQLNLQLTAAQQESSLTKGMYDSLLKRQSEQSALADAEQEKAMKMSTMGRQENVGKASSLLKLLGQRRTAQQDSTRSRGSTSAYSQAGVNVNSLLR